ncbi:shikimate kinase [[Phormidium] sp. ETS-05]|uniref:shikimate kinase n=1 Tax=[Phormidium] sp. ETS-05 TaxID=222819 RepID=UPI001E29D8F6|nr:shikimate kinase [[Phormidium] sp. ETS-05]
MVQLIQGINLYLVGIMGAGKSTVGRILARELGYRFFDTDNLIAQIAGKSITEIFAEAGEDGFRELETKVLSQLCAYKNLVVATGGGMVLRRENWSYLHHGIVVWLDVPLDVLQTRLQGDATRPLLQDPDPWGKLRSLLDQRLHLYAQADVKIKVTAEATPQHLAQEVLMAIPQVLKRGPEDEERG